MKRKRSRAAKPKKQETASFRPLESALRERLSKQAQEEGKAEANASPPPKPASEVEDASLSIDDRTLLRQFMAGTVPLDRGAGRIPRTASKLEARDLPKVPEGPDPDDEARARLRELVAGTSTFETVDDGMRIEGRRADVDPRTLRRLRHGVLPIDARLDLHGKMLDEAKRAVEAFISERKKSHDRVLLIIHGKGRHSLGGMGVLRGEIGAWLSSGPASHNVACFATARDIDGGTGAVYVLLRK